MRYTYRCSRCETTTVRNVPVDDRDSQQCECGRVLTRLFDKPTIHIPLGMTAAFGDHQPVTPTDETQAETWRKDQIQPAGSRWI